jgi:hypothetical protein
MGIDGCYVEFDVLEEVPMSNTIFRDVTPCSMIILRRLEGSTTFEWSMNMHRIASRHIQDGRSFISGKKPRKKALRWRGYTYYFFYYY